MHSRATDRRSASKCQGKWPDQTLGQAFGLPEVLVAVSTSRLSCKRAGKTRTLMPVWESSGESRLRSAEMKISQTSTLDTLYSQGIAFGEGGDFPRALECFAKALAIAPDEPELLYNMGLTLHKSGDHRAA